MIAMPRGQWECGYRHLTLWGWGRGDIRNIFLEWTPEPNPEGSVSARQEKVRRGQPGRGNRHGEGGGRTRSLVLAEASGKETADNLWACSGLNTAERWIHPVRLGPLPGRWR